MIPALETIDKIHPLYKQYLDELHASKFSGDITTRFSERLLVATDNSIYQVMSEAVVFPKNQRDVEILFIIGKQEKYRDITFTAKGGGTGIVGQTLSSGITIDCSRYLRNIIELNVAEKWVRVQPGIPLGELNEKLKSHGLFFAPVVSSGDRATLGGMVSTDGAGIGSRVYGKTSQHVLSITATLIDGTVHEFKSCDQNTLNQLQSRADQIGEIYRLVEKIICDKQEEIKKHLKPLGRQPSGYNLQQVLHDEIFNLNYMLCGSEGSLIFISEIKLNLLPIPKYRALFVVHYKDFSTALSAARDALILNPTTIETIGDKVMETVKEDAMFPLISKWIIDVDKNDVAKSLDFMEFRVNSQMELDAKIIEATNYLNEKKSICNFRLIKNLDDILLIWEFRSRVLGVLNNTPGNRRPVGFVEDSMVPLQYLPEYVKELEALFEKYNIKFGAYGHCDVGCLHIRPLLDLTDPNDEALMQKLYVECFNLVEKFGGVLWGEHGRGFRSAFGEKHFGEKLFRAFREIKTVFDPFDRFNPGKLFTSLKGQRKLVDPYNSLRAHNDREISKNIRENFFPEVINCNGNAVCFNYHLDNVMCPSEKATKNRWFSPKGRAVAMREWLRQLQLKNNDVTKIKPANFFQRSWNSLRKKQDYSREVFETMKECLECKACASHCQNKVNVPGFKAKFLEQYYTRYQRSLKDFLLAHIERIAPLQEKFPRFNNFFAKTFFYRMIMRAIGLVDLPQLSYPALKNNLQKNSANFFDLSQAEKMSQDEIKKSIVLLPDVVTTYYDSEVVKHFYELLSRLGYRVLVLPFIESGKPLHAKGYLQTFRKIVNRNVVLFNKISALGFPIIGIDPSITLCFRDEYAQFSNEKINFNILLMQEFLLNKLNEFPQKNNSELKKTYYLFSHCTEKSLAIESPMQWQKIFAHFNIDLKIINTGCCGMAGSYGYETCHQKTSKNLFELSWKTAIETIPTENILCTGFSCRHQVKRMLRFAPKHPAEMLLKTTNI